MQQTEKPTNQLAKEGKLERMEKDLELIYQHYGIDNSEMKKWPKGSGVSVSDQPIKFIRCLEFLPQRINVKKKVRIIIDYDPDFPYAVLQTIGEDQPEIKEQEQPGGKA